MVVYLCRYIKWEFDTRRWQGGCAGVHITQFLQWCNQMLHQLERSQRVDTLNDSTKYTWRFKPQGINFCLQHPEDPACVGHTIYPLEVEPN